VACSRFWDLQVPDQTSFFVTGHIRIIEIADELAVVFSRDCIGEELSTATRWKEDYGLT
jgi:hypothetical protein